MSKGRIYPRETKEVRDPQTGAHVLQLTTHYSINHHLYHLVRSTTPDMSSVIFCSNRAGTWQFFRMGLYDGDIVQLTDVPGGVHGYSGQVTLDGRELLYTTGGQVRAVRLDDLSERVLAEWEGASLGEVSLSGNGEWLVTAMKWKSKNYLAVVKTDGTRAETIFECPRTIIHPQFHPADDTWIEYAQDPAPRMWLIRRDGSSNTCLYEHDNETFIVHETWLGTTGDLVLTQWPYRLMRYRLSAPPDQRLTVIAEFNAWHISPNRAGTKILCDTNHPDRGILLVDAATGERVTLCYPNASCQGSQWKLSRYALKEDFERAGKEDWALSWMEARVDTVYGPQWTHPHPSWSHDEAWCIYDSDVSGKTQVYAVKIEQ
jgi:oligogalacturonide lyase